MTVKFYLIVSLIFFTFPVESHQKINMIEKGSFWKWDLPSQQYNIHFLEKGEGSRHVILIHGFGAHSYTWRFLMDDLANAGFHTWSLDLLGFGFSDKPTGVHYRLPLFVNLMNAFMESKNIQKASLIGNSMGGGIALATAIFHPQSVESLVLINPLAFPLKLPFHFVLCKVLGKFGTFFYGKHLTKQVLKQIIHDHQTISEEQIEAFALPFQMPGGKEAFLNTLQNFDNKQIQDIVAHYHQIKVPLLILWGENDRWIPFNHYEQLTHTFPFAKKILIPKCGHIPQEESPSEVLKALFSFYQDESSFPPVSSTE